MSDVEETDGEVCDSCGRSYDITYRVPDDVWLKIVPTGNYQDWEAVSEEGHHP